MKSKISQNRNAIFSGAKSAVVSLARQSLEMTQNATTKDIQTKKRLQKPKFLRRRRDEDGVEKCLNPFRKRMCGRPDIEVYMMFDNERLPICSKCWTKIAKSDYEW